MGVLIRIYGIENPLTEAWNIRQAQTAMMTRNIYADGFAFLPTRLNFFGNSDGSIILEFPLMHVITALSYWLFGVNEMFGRIVSLVFYLMSAVVFTLIASRYLAQMAVIVSLFVFTVSPMNIYLSRAFMPESSMMLFYLSGFYFFSVYLESARQKHLIIGVASLCLAPLTKPPAGIAFLPIILSVFMSDINKNNKIRLLALIFLCALPFALWGGYAHFVNASNSNLPEGWGGNWLDIIFGRGGVFSNWLSFEFYRNVGGSIILVLMTPIGFVACLVGLFSGFTLRKFEPIRFWLLGCVVFVFIFAGANRGHPYYQIFFLPPLCLYCGLCFEKFGLTIVRYLKTRIGVVISALLLVANLYGYYAFYQYMYDPHRRMPYVFAAAELLHSNIPQNRYVLIHQKNATSGVLDYYLEGKSKPINLKDEKFAIDVLSREVLNGANAFVSINTVYGNSVAELKRSQRFYEKLQSIGSLVFSNEVLVIYRFD